MHANSQTLRNNVAPKLVGNFFTVDLPATRTAFESVPWVRRAVVSREFPDRLRVSLREQQAVALWGYATGSKMLNDLAEVFEANVGEVEQEDLPRLIGPDTQSAHLLDMYRALEPVLEPLDQDHRATRIDRPWRLARAALTRTPRSSWGRARLPTCWNAPTASYARRENVTKQQGRDADAIRIGRFALRRRVRAAAARRDHRRRGRQDDDESKKQQQEKALSDKRTDTVKTTNMAALRPNQQS